MHPLCRLLVVLLLSAPLTLGAQEADSGQNASASADALPRLAGLWAQKVVTTAISDVPVVGEVTTQTVSLQQVEITQDGAALELTTRVCDIAVHSSIDLVQTEIPDRFVQAMGVGKREAKLVARGGDHFFMAPRKTELLGVRLRDPKNEYLPSDKDDPRVFDQDEDGQPGVTVNVSGMVDGSLYIVHRGWDKLQGKVQSQDRIAGGVEWDLEQKVVDSTSIFLGDPPDSRAHPSAKKNFFRMQRMPDGTSCADIKQERANL